MTAVTAKKLLLFGGLFASFSVLAEALPEIDCLIEPNMVIELSSPVSGVLDTIAVDRSDAVNAGQIVATLQSDVEQVKLKASQETLSLSRVEQKRAKELYRDNAITLSEKEQADHEVALARLEVESSQASLEQRRIRSPLDGVVADRYLMPGEFIEENPILKIAQLDPLRVEVVAPVTYFGQIKTGMHAQVKTEFGSFENLIAEVVVVDKVIDAASGTFGIRLELPNADNRIPGGLKCSVRFFDESEEAEYAGLGADDAVLPGSDEDSSQFAAPATTEQESPETDTVSTCHRVGPFSTKESLQALMAALETEINAHEIREETSTTTIYRVTTDTLASREAAKALESEMKQAGVTDLAVVRRESGFAISLGLFSKQQSASKRQANMKKLGYDSKVIPRDRINVTYWVEVTADLAKDELSQRVAAAGVKGTDDLLYQSCSTEILASGD